jgi:aminopeptidase N
MKHDTTAIRLADYRPADFAIDTVDLHVRLDPEKTRITARLAMRPVTRGVDLDLAGDELTLIALSLDGAQLPADRIEVSPQGLVIKHPPDRPFRLEIVTEINPGANTKLMGLYRSGGTYCTQCEAEGFRRITYFLDRPDVLAVYTTRIEAEKSVAPILLGNGNLTEAGDLPGSDRHYAVWHDPFPKPSYLFAMVAGDLGVLADRFTTASGRQVDLHIYCEHGKEPRLGWAMESLKRAMRWDETAFGREYDLDVFNIVAVSAFNMGAMENKGLNIFNDKLVLADADTATDADYGQIEAVIAHEYFHNWTGDRITCRDWFQLCLKEGLTVYRDQEFTADVRSRPVKRISDVLSLKARQFPEDAGPLAHAVRPEIYHEINNFYTATVYDKGAEVVRMLKTVLGIAGFRAGMDLYFDRHDGQAVTIEDFLTCFADANSRDLSQFKLWYEQAGTPEVIARGHFDAGKKTYALTLAQKIPPTPGQPTKQPMHVPVRFGLVGPNGDDLAFDSTTGPRVDGGVIHLTESEQTVVFHGVAARPVPSLLRDFSAPVRLTIDLSADEQLFLLRTDADPYNRWHAAQALMTTALTEGTAEARRGGRARFDERLIDALMDVGDDERLEPAFRALVLRPPGEADIAREIARDVDPEAIATARNQVRAAIASRGGPRLAALADRMHDRGPFSPDAAAAGRRSLAATALGLSTASGDRHAIDRVVRRYHDADNMTERSAALGILAAGAFEERHDALADFRQRYRDDPLVLDKWFTLEAIVPAPETLDRVKALLDDPAFSLSNPNRIRALVGAFAAGNQTEFNRPDGAGYEFLADFVLDLDRRNPQVAARLLVSFRSWRALEARRRGLAEPALRRVADAGQLSSDTRDIVTRTLA